MVRISRALPRKMSRPSRGQKYGNRPTTVDGHRFASQREAGRYGELLMLQKAGEISELQLQVRYEFIVNDVKVTSYIADFTYIKKGERFTTVEDVKGVRTRVFIIKANLMRAVYGITVQEV